MFSKSAKLYDKIYLEFKDYETETRNIRKLINREDPRAQVVLDVACGTGEHAKILQDRYGFEVDGIDLDEKLVSLAQIKNPGGIFTCADMADFDLNKSYDVVMCLFSSIGYLKTLARVTQALEMFKAHTNNGGLIIVEPWFTPEALTPGKISLNTVRNEEMVIARMGYSHIKDRISTIHFEYLIGGKGKVRHEVEKHELGLFTTEEMKRCFKDVQLNARFEKVGLSNKGLFIAKKDA